MHLSLIAQFPDSVASQEASDFSPGSMSRPHVILHLKREVLPMNTHKLPKSGDIPWDEKYNDDVIVCN